ncbi:hypothetical protein F4776DRAFT_636743 [Hypoxylon sp. NC0597]|nr:hypothetical protein F4776DRAFT_636743 [Hypoxylon sp. NC0597]
MTCSAAVVCFTWLASVVSLLWRSRLDGNSVTHQPLEIFFWRRRILLLEPNRPSYSMVCAVVQNSTPKKKSIQ